MEVLNHYKLKLVCTQNIDLIGMNVRKGKALQNYIKSTGKSIFKKCHEYITKLS